MHDIVYDAMHDEFVVPVPYSDAILTFRGGADGQDPPIRVIQGPKTGEIGSRLALDPIHNEIFTYRHNSIVVFPRTANGNTAPIRILRGPDTQLRDVYSLAVDPVNNVLVVGLNSGWDPQGQLRDASEAKGALLIFHRTDQGDAKPIGVIRGDKSQIIRINQMQVYPARKEIVAAMPGIRDRMKPPHAFVGVWSEDDNGDVPPKYEIPIGRITKLNKPFGVVLIPKHKEIVVSDMRNQGILTFSVPEIF